MTFTLTPPTSGDCTELLEDLERERDQLPDQPAFHDHPLLPLVELLKPNPCPVCRVHTFRPCSAARTAVEIGCPGIELQKLRVEFQSLKRRRPQRRQDESVSPKGV